jgi:hypothetical protein
MCALNQKSVSRVAAKMLIHNLIVVNIMEATADQHKLSDKPAFIFGK